MWGAAALAQWANRRVHRGSGARADDRRGGLRGVLRTRPWPPCLAGRTSARHEADCADRPGRELPPPAHDAPTASACRSPAPGKRSAPSKPTATTLDLNWNGPLTAPDGTTFDISVKLSTTVNGDGVSFRGSLTNRSAATVEEARYPHARRTRRLCVAGPAQPDRPSTLRPPRNRLPPPSANTP